MAGFCQGILCAESSPPPGRGLSVQVSTRASRSLVPSELGQTDYIWAKGREHSSGSAERSASRLSPRSVRLPALHKCPLQALILVVFRPSSTA